MRQMPKIRIHELAKELNVDNKAVMDYLKENRIEVKSHMSTLEDNQEAMVRKAFSSRPAGKEEKQEAAPKKAEAPKKKNIIQVFRPQNATTKEARNSRRFQNDRNGNGRPQHGERRGIERPQAPEREKARAASQEHGAVRAQSQEKPQTRPAGNQPENRESRPQAATSGSGERQNRQGDRGQGSRSFGDRQGRGGDRSQGGR